MLVTNMAETVAMETEKEELQEDLYRATLSLDYEKVRSLIDQGTGAYFYGTVLSSLMRKIFVLSDNLLLFLFMIF